MTQSKISVLLIEDDLLDAKMVRRLLRGQDVAYQVTTAETFAAARSLMEANEFDVLLVDLGLPDAEPYEPVIHARSLGKTFAILVLSGHPDQCWYVDAIKSGADDYICKDDLSGMLLQCRIEQARQRVEQQMRIRVLLETVESQNSDLGRIAEDLQLKNQRLEQLCDSANQFVNHVSHEFRTPLCVIKQYASLLADGGFGDMSTEQAKTLHLIEDRVDGLNNLVDDMLDISRHDAGLLSAKRESCQPTDFIERELHGLQQRASVRNVTIAYQADDQLPAIFCDQEKAGRVLTNLVSNAIKYSPPESQVKIRVAMAETRQEVAIEVQDQGPGISVNEMKNIFTRFQVASSARVISEKGFGLGLCIAREMAELNLGNLTVRSVKGEGSTFMFTLPIDDPFVIVNRYLDFVEQTHRDHPFSLTRINVLIDEEASPEQTSAIHSVLDFVLRCHDLLLSTSSHQWQATVMADRTGAQRFIERVREELAEAKRNGPSIELPEVRFSMGETTSWNTRETSESERYWEQIVDNKQDGQDEEFMQNVRIDRGAQSKIPRSQRAPCDGKPMQDTQAWEVADGV